MVPAESLYTVAGGGAGRDGVRADGGHHGEYADLVDAAAFRAGYVHVLHGTAGRTWAAETAFAIPDAFLPDDFGGRRVGRGLRGVAGAADFPLVLRDAAGAGVVRGAGADRAARRSGRQLVRPAAAAIPLDRGGGRAGGARVSWASQADPGDATCAR